SLVKHHGRTYFEPIGKALQTAGIKKPNMANPAHAWALRKPLWDYTRWWMGHRLPWGGDGKPAAPHDVGAGNGAASTLASLPRELRRHAEFAAEFLSRSSFEISGTMRKHQLKLADRQCRMAELSGRVQMAVVILCTSLYASRHHEDAVRVAA